MEIVTVPVADPLAGNLPADRMLSAATRARIIDAVPDETNRAYTRQWQQWQQWCDEHGRTPMPATGETLAEYVAHLAETERSPATIEQATAAIRTRHRHAGHRGQPDTTAARLVLRGHRRTLAENGQRARQAPPITIETLRAMVDATPTGAAGLRDKLVLVLGLALMARRSELAALRRDDLTFTDEGLEVLIRTSKTDQEGRGAVVAIPPGQYAETDPVGLARAWLVVLSLQNIPGPALLRSVTRHGQIGAGLSGTAINDLVRRAAERASLPNAHLYSAHSLRAGGATAAYRAGAPVSIIAAHGRWSPHSPVVLSYVRSADRWRDNAIRGIGL